VTAAYGPEELKRDLGVSRETVERLETHRRLLAEWSEHTNLVGPRELEHYWRRHALDCAQLIKFAPEARSWLDLGAGAGFPGIVVACCLADDTAAAVHLIEATGKKAKFLDKMIQTAGLPAKVFNMRIEDFDANSGAHGFPYEVVTARALAPLKRIFGYAKPVLDRGAVGLFHKGSKLEAELRDARKALGGASGPYRLGPYKADVLESLSDPRGRILRIEKAA
jgi:16S rRNA (guanine527-N7)-methyltransferase